MQCLLSSPSGIRADVQGMALSSGDKTAFIPLDVHAYMRPITTLFTRPRELKVVHDLKPTLLAFHRIGVTLARPYLDTMIADYLLNPNRRDHQLDTLAVELFGHRLGSGARTISPGIVVRGGNRFAGKQTRNGLRWSRSSRP